MAPQALEAGTWFHQGQFLCKAPSFLWNHARELASRFVFGALWSYLGFASVLRGLVGLVRRQAKGNTTRWMVGALTLGCTALMLRA